MTTSYVAAQPGINTLRTQSQEPAGDPPCPAAIAQMALLLVSGVYYSVEVLPQWQQVVAAASPATYALEGIRDALLDGASLIDLLPTLGILTFFGAITVPLGLVVFSWGEAYAKRTG